MTTTVKELNSKWQQGLATDDGLDFILKHFEGAQPLWPRKVSTLATEGVQVRADSKEDAMTLFERAHFIDVRINAYPMYRERILYEPNHLFIDIDREHFSTEQDFLQAVNATLYNIKSELGGNPSVVHSGNGVHIHQPLDMPGPLESIPDFANFKEPSQQFLGYAEDKLSNGKADPSHTPSFRSCLIRVPGSYNLKCIKSGKGDAQVKIVQRWDGIRARPCREFMRKFHAYLVQKVIDDKVANIERQNRLRSAGFFKSSNTSTPWIEKLLQSGIDDNRKDLIFWLLAPYLITVRHLEYNSAHAIIEEWLNKCDDVRRLQPSWSYFRSKIRDSLHYAQNKDRWPTPLHTFKEYYPDVYKALE